MLDEGVKEIHVQQVATFLTLPKQKLPAK